MSRIYTSALKPLTDRLGALAGLLLLAPLIAGTFIVVRVRLGKPALFRQSRTGKDGALFNVVKFRSMTDERDSNGNLLDDAVRLTATGRFLRASSLDELPQLWNVLRGDMSLVGPRPLLPAYLPRYNAFQRRRHNVKPGITGLAQVSGRNAISWEQKFELDVQYAENVSAGMDAKILWLTVLRVLGRKDISSEGHVTSPEFLGSVRDTGSAENREICS